MAHKYTSLEPTEKPKDGKMKCSAKGFCWLLKRFFTEANRRGINPVVLTSFETFKARTVGVAFKQTESDQGTMFNNCPMCGADLKPLRDAKPKRRAGALK